MNDRRISVPTHSFIHSFIHSLLAKAGVAQLVEHQPSKLRVAGSSLVARSDLIGGIMGNINLSCIWRYVEFGYDFPLEPGQPM